MHPLVHSDSNLPSAIQFSPIVRALQAVLFGLLSGGVTHAAAIEAESGTPDIPLQTVTVTATRGADGTAADGYRVRRSGIAGFSEQDLLDTPSSVKVLPAALLLNQKIETIAGIDRLDASVSSPAASPGWFSSPTIRGFTLDNASNFRYNGQTVGKRSAGIPYHQFSLWTDYGFGDFGLPGLKLGAGGRYVGETVSMWHDTPAPACTVGDVMVSYRTGPWRLALNISNVTDKTYLASCPYTCFYGEPRKAIGSLSYRW